MNYKTGILYLEKIKRLYNEIEPFLQNLQDYIQENQGFFKNMGYEDFMKITKLHILTSENLKLKYVNLLNFPTFDYGINFVKLDAWLFNELIGIEKNLHDLSGIEKLEKFLEYKKASDLDKKRIMFLI